ILTNVASLLTAGIISSLIFAVAYPMTIIASTLYYMRRKEQKAERAAQGLLGDSPGAAFWLRVRHPLTGGRGRQQTPVEEPLANPGEGAIQPG
ncbi:MAG: hypothetical protein ACR2OE_13120, partial [Thermomicrobiales bacterium]